MNYLMISRRFEYTAPERVQNQQGRLQRRNTLDHRRGGFLQIIPDGALRRPEAKSY
jgi:hypothetical protein